MEQMRKIFYIPGLLLLSISVTFCSDEFLSQNNLNTYALSDTLYLFNNQENVDTTIQTPVLTNSDYTIFMQPKWVSFNSMHGKLSGGTVTLSFSIVKEEIPPEFQTESGTIMLDVENVGLISFIVVFSNFGSPVINCSASALNFESSSFQTFTISNEAEGILKWKITGIPDWLTISPTTGLLNYGNSITITASLNFANITQAHDLSATLKINSNSASGSFDIAVNVPEKAIIISDVRQINGIVTDAEFSHESGILAICTKSPNSLIVFKTYSNESNTISLGKTPNCVSLSEDGHNAVIGYAEPSVSYIDIDNLEIINDYSIDCIPYDIVLGNSGWCYITPTVDQWVFFRNLNLNTGELISGTNGYTIYEKTILRKIHGKSYLVGSSMGLSPTGIYIFDVTKGLVNDTVSYYFESIGNFWISEDGTKLYGSNKNVYSLPEYDTQYHPFAPPVYGQIESEMYFISAFDECPAISSIFIASSYYEYAPDYSSLIEQFDATNLNKIRTFNVSPVYVTENEIKTLYETNSRFIFVNKEGSDLYAIKNLKEYYYKDYWTIEIFQLDNSGKSGSGFHNFRML